MGNWMRQSLKQAQASYATLNIRHIQKVNLRRVLPCSCSRIFHQCTKTQTATVSTCGLGLLTVGGHL